MCPLLFLLHPVSGLTIELNPYSTDVNFIAAQALARQREAQDVDAAADTIMAEGGDELDAMADLERQARAPAGFVAAKSGPDASKVAVLRDQEVERTAGEDGGNGGGGGELDELDELSGLGQVRQGQGARVVDSGEVNLDDDL